MIPFSTLTYFNAQVYIVIQRRRKHIGRRLLNPESNAIKAEHQTTILNLLQIELALDTAESREFRECWIPGSRTINFSDTFDSCS